MHTNRKAQTEDKVGCVCEECGGLLGDDIAPCLRCRVFAGRLAKLSRDVRTLIVLAGTLSGKTPRSRNERTTIGRLVDAYRRLESRRAARGVPKTWLDFSQETSPVTERVTDDERLISEARARAEKATPGPIAVHRYDEDDASISWQLQQDNGEGIVLCAFDDEENVRARSDATFHAAARADVLALCDLAEGLMRENKALRAIARLAAARGKGLAAAEREYFGGAHPNDAPEAHPCLRCERTAADCSCVGGPFVVDAGSKDTADEGIDHADPAGCSCPVL